MADFKIDPPGHPPLGGEAPFGRYGFEDEAGMPMEGGEAIFPILVQRDSSSYELVGTGFFITNFGIFVTAKHVLEKDRECGYKFFVWQLLPPDHWDICPVDQVSMHPKFDLAVGVVSRTVNTETGEEMIHSKVSLSLGTKYEGDIVVTYAYPNTVIETEAKLLSFKPDFYEGLIIEDLPNGRDNHFLPGPCYRTDMRIHHGASGGPVACGMKGKVFAINSTGFDGVPECYISKIDPILELKIKAEGNQGEEEATIKELADLGFVAIDE